MDLQNIINQMAMQDPGYYERRFKEFRNAMIPFEKELFRIFSLMPGGYRIDMETKELTQHIPPEWQELIDNINRLRDEYIKSNFPEFIQLP